jgi:uncharacterized surface protein with fasciclin (FAS1) repeats
VHVIDTVLLPFPLPPLPHPFDLKAAALIAAAVSATAITATTLSTIAAVEIYKALAAAGLVPAIGGAGGRNATSPPPPPACSTVAALVAATPSLSTLLAAVQVANLTAALSSQTTPMTVFAPTNAAIAALLTTLNVSAASLLANKALLTKVLTLHVVPGVAAFAANLSNGQTLLTVGGERLTVLLGNGSVTIRAPSSTAKVTTPNLVACAAVVHIIDTVLLPAVPAVPSPPIASSPPVLPSPAASPPPAVTAQSGPPAASPPPAMGSPLQNRTAPPPQQQSGAAGALSLAATLMAAAAALVM